MQHITLNEGQSGRLDKILSEILPFSRAKIQHAIKNGSIQMNNKATLVKTLVTAGDVISYDETVFYDVERSGDLPKLHILFENDDVIVIDKQAGVIVHPADSTKEMTLVDSLLEHYPDIKDVGDDPIRPGIVHRLDKLASGVMIIAKTQEAFTYLKAQFKNRTAKKHYRVLVHGNFSEESGTINFPISRAKNSGRMAAKPLSQGGRDAITHYTVLNHFENYDELDVHIETGRTHQIRAHMFASDHPVVGDKLYKQRNTKERDIGRLFLHAYSLTIELPNGEQETFTTPLPDELQTLLDSLV
ncbi:MAG: RluA family pseudouridine synthase [bacterium]|nr:RluA family pseudouridine synthase [bacterium]